MVKAKNDSAQTFSCRNCGHPYTVYPPDSSFEHAFISPCQESSSDPNHNLKTIYECEDCHNRNELYWCQGHLHVYGANPRRNLSESRKLRSDLYE